MGNCTIACGPYNKVLPKKTDIIALCDCDTQAYVCSASADLSGSDNSVTGESGLFLTFHGTLR